MVEIKVPNKMLHSVQQGCGKPIAYREESTKIRVSIGLKRKKAMAQLVKEVRGTNQ